MALPKKYILHAEKVDRLAIVDRPCVPDAQIVLFKRRDDEVDDQAEENAVTEFSKSVETLTKIGRKISGARMKKIKDALGILTGLIDEVVAAETTAMNMTPEQMANRTQAMLQSEQQTKKLQEDVISLQETVKSLTKVIDDKSISLKAFVEKFLNETINEAFIKSESKVLKEAKDEIVKVVKERDEKSQQITKGFEESEKKRADALEKRFKELEVALEKHKQNIFDLNGKFGIKKTSLDVDFEEKRQADENERDAVFSNAVKGKKKVQ